MTEDEMVEWHHRCNEHEFEQAAGVGDEQGSLAYCSPWGCKESDTTKRLHTHMRSLFSAKEHPTCQSTVSKNAGDTRPCGGYSVQFIY